MSFKFDFDEGDLDDELNTPEAPRQDSDQNVGDKVISGSPRPGSSGAVPSVAFRQHDLRDLIDTLPAKLSYSPITLSSANGAQSRILPRRDLFDIRFQLIASEDDEPDDRNSSNQAGMVEDLTTFVDTPSDLVPGVYEGGLKTWECSLDLVTYLSASESQLKGKRVLEVGCGTAIPSCFVLQELFCDQWENLSAASITHLCVQDFNASVIRLVTFPNLLLAWYFSPATAIFRADHAAAQGENPADIAIAGEVTIDDNVKDGFVEALQSRDIHLTLLSGAWSDFKLPEEIRRFPRPFDIILTSETIYESANIPSLLAVLKMDKALLSEHMAEVSLAPREQGALEQPLILVAAKVLYFGVGGGVKEFSATVQRHGGDVERVWEQTHGVGRTILRLRF